MDLTCKLHLSLTVGLKKEHCAFDLYTISSQKQGDGYETVWVFFLSVPLELLLKSTSWEIEIVITCKRGTRSSLFHSSEVKIRMLHYSYYIQRDKKH